MTADPPASPAEPLEPPRLLRLLRLEDAAELAALVQANREFLKPYDPHRAEAYFTEAGQRTRLGRLLAEHARGAVLPLAVLVEAGAIAGQVTLNAIEHGPFRSARLGYWVAADHGGRGLATAAVAEVLRVAFDGELDLARVEAATLLDNSRSQRVLERSGFRPIGVAPAYLEIDGTRRDHLMFSRVRG